MLILYFSEKEKRTMENNKGLSIASMACGIAGCVCCWTGWGGILGYYSPNVNIPSVDGDPALAEWKGKCIVEDVQYIDEAYNSVSKFINMALSGN